MGFGKGDKPASSGSAPYGTVHFGYASAYQAGRAQPNTIQKPTIPEHPELLASPGTRRRPPIKSKPSADVHPSQVIEYLMKKGYLRTEQVLRQESAQVDKDGRPVFGRDEYGNEKYIRGFELLSSWIDSNLDIYKVSRP